MVATVVTVVTADGRHGQADGDVDCNFECSQEAARADCMYTVLQKHLDSYHLQAGTL